MHRGRTETEQSNSKLYVVSSVFECGGKGLEFWLGRVRRSGVIGGEGHEFGLEFRVQSIGSLVYGVVYGVWCCGRQVCKSMLPERYSTVLGPLGFC